ncbi:DUF1641 domain-containing protein [Xanthomonas campestris]|uniref:DUF1641 domain-containing protein n=1 Tax=Xanthomonas campestris TaxID=339 RepID=UPI000A48DADC|nr:hypothetical protein [Xanthomonas campestris]MEB1152883.1 hypothetical protein [Xanthomonas campestris pv. campestris]MCC5097706.1 hypothetical protein [Xanthomonas campestris]MEA9584860.1 hypothetical protein [Xanthomonas campestris]MEA9591818.1 hypothetical protein [Xanthomonas campestris]MEA9623319.1 hypothetical protein [Xanthomonas campestris]
MAEPLDYDVKPTPTGPTAREELDRLLETLHRRGILRLANDLVGAQDKLAKVLVDGINQPGPLNALQNVSILAMAVSRIPPSQFYKVVFAGKDALDQIARRPQPRARRPACAVHIGCCRTRRCGMRSRQCSMA